MTTASAVTLLTVLKKNEYSALEYVDMSVSSTERIGRKCTHTDMKFRKIWYLKMFFHVFVQSVHVYKESLTLIKEIQQIRPTFDFVYGGIVSSDDQFGMYTWFHSPKTHCTKFIRHCYLNVKITVSDCVISLSQVVMVHPLITVIHSPS